MFNKIKMFSLAACAALVLQACHSDDDALFATLPDAAPKLVGDIRANSYVSLRKNGDLNNLFVLAGTVAGTGVNVGDEPCNVKMHKLDYATIGGAGEATTSTGVAMIPYGDNAACTGSRPVVLYAHGTNVNKDYDLAAFPGDTENASASEAGLLLAFYASQGYVVIAPNYAGYAGSKLDYHPYVDEKQQSTEMIDALNHVRKYAGDIGADLSSKLFITGVSQGGYVAMATHKALQVAGEAVTASAPISGPYAMGKFLDTVMSGNINGGASMFAPMYLTALQRSSDIYTNANEVYASTPKDYASIAEAILPASKAVDASSVGLPGDANVFDLFAPNFITQYSNASNDGATVVNAASKVRNLAYEADMQDWAPSPSSPVVMCGASDDPVVFHTLNSDTMATHWASLVNLGLVTNLDLTDALNPSNPYVQIQGAWQQARATGDISVAALHSATGAYCSGAALATFNKF